MTKRVQFWLNAIDGAMRSRYPSRMSVVPFPKASVAAAYEKGAYVFTTSICMNIDVVLEGRKNEPESKDLKISYLEDGRLDTDINREKCNSTDKAKELILYINSNTEPLNGCQMKFKQGRLVVNSLCENNNFIQNGSSIYLPSMTNFITVYDNLMKEMSEKELVAVLTHELAHYYRAHINYKFVQFFYKIEQNNSKSRPVKNATYEALGEELKQLANLEDNSTNAKKKKRVEEIKNQRLGYYTAEQEADEFSIEMLSFINMPLQTFGDGMMKLLKETETKNILWPDYSYEKCKALKDNNWKEANGVDAFIPFGGVYLEKEVFTPHHSACFRAWNIDREIKAHNYVINSSLEPVPPGGSYAEILTTYRKYDDINKP